MSMNTIVGRTVNQPVNQGSFSMPCSIVYMNAIVNQLACEVSVRSQTRMKTVSLSLLCVRTKKLLVTFVRMGWRATFTRGPPVA